MLEGSGRMEVAGDEREVGPGDAILIPPRVARDRGERGGELRFLCCCAPPYSDADTFFE